MPSALTFDAPLSPDRFHGRGSIVKDVDDRLFHSGFLSSSVVGGPKTGKTSFLHYLAARPAPALPNNPEILHIYFDADILGGNHSTPYEFWTGIFRAIKADARCNAFDDLLDKKIAQATGHQLDEYDLHDLFDALAKAGKRVALLVDNFDTPLHNDNFWTNNDFFHHVRTLGQRIPRGLAFVTTSPRPLLEFRRPGVLASPYYNVFVNLPLGMLGDDDLVQYVRAALTDVRIDPDDAEIVAVVKAASKNHPYVANFVLGHCIAKKLAHEPIDQAAIGAALKDPAGPVVTLIQQILGQLSPFERQLLDLAKKGGLTPYQQKNLDLLKRYGLVPPGYAI